MNENNRLIKLKYNTIVQFIYQFVALAYGFIIPNLIISTYGSNTNGLINSITKFLSVISLLDLGIGRVVQTSLYSPLLRKDCDAISEIYISAQKFFRKLAMILLFYVIILITVYPIFVNNSFEFSYIALLIASISISSFIQYYFGIVNGLLLSADQKGYIQYTSKIVALILNTIVCILFIKLNFPVQLVYFFSSLVFLISPMYLFFYVKRNYNINKEITYINEPIKQKWNGIAQHISSFILDGTDIIVLTLMSTLSNVSVYSVYILVINGIKSVLLSLTNGFQALFGELYTHNNHRTLKKYFLMYHWGLNVITTFLFGCTSVLITNFISVYTKNLNDINYTYPIFGFLIAIAYMGDWLRSPYMMLIFASGLYKETQYCYIIGAILNLSISIILVKFLGLIGIVIGTIIAMYYQVIWMAYYTLKRIINLPIKVFIKQITINILTFGIAFFATFKIPMISKTYPAWGLKAVLVVAVWSIVTMIVNLTFYKEQSLLLIKKFKRKIRG